MRNHAWQHGVGADCGKVQRRQRSAYAIAAQRREFTRPFREEKMGVHCNLSERRIDFAGMGQRGDDIKIGLRHKRQIQLGPLR